MNTFDKMASLAQKKFPKANTLTHLQKIHEEIDEAINSLKQKGQVDIYELADIQLALYAAASKAGYKQGQLESAAEKKLKVLRKRQWEWKNGQYKHI